MTEARLRPLRKRPPPKIEADPTAGRLIMTCIINLSVYPRDWPIRGWPVRGMNKTRLLSRLICRRECRGWMIDGDEVHEKNRAGAVPKARRAISATILDGLGLKSHQADLVSGLGEVIMNLFYPSCSISSPSSLSLGNNTKCDHRTNSLSTKPFPYIAFCVHSVVCGYASPVIPLLFSFSSTLPGFLYHSPIDVHNPS